MSSYSPSGAALPPLPADKFTLKCETGLIAVGFLEGEVESLPVRVVCALVTMSVVSAWFNRRNSIRGKLLLFFSHWLSGLLCQLAFVVQVTMILACWTSVGLEGFVKAVKFVELASCNMYAITNLAISVNLAEIVMSHRTLSTVRSGSSFLVMLLSLILSVGAAAASVPFWELTIITGTEFWPANENERIQNWITVSMFCVEFFVGVCMLLIVTCLLLFWTEEVKTCWTLHARIRYYFGLTVVGTAVYLTVGICGTVFVIGGGTKPSLIILTWALRYMHIALDTIVLYGVLGTRGMGERVGSSHVTSAGGASGGHNRVAKRSFPMSFDSSRKISSNRSISPQSSFSSFESERPRL